MRTLSQHLALVALFGLAACGPTEESANNDGADTALDAGGSDDVSPDGSSVGDVGGDVSVEDVRADVDADTVDDPPIAHTDFLPVVRGDTVEVDVLANDVDPEGGELTIQDVTQPSAGEVELDGGVLRFTASAISQTTSFTYVVADAGGATDEAMVHVTGYERPVASDAPVVLLPRTGLRPDDLAVVIDEGNPDSVVVGEHFAATRRLPDQNVIRVTLPTDGDVMTSEEFQTVYAEVDAQRPEGIQAYALAWIAPYRVSCQSITTAFAVGEFDDAYCNTTGQTCGGTAPVSYYNSDSVAPWDDHQLRPTMMLATTTADDGRALVDRGAAADGTFPTGVGQLVRTTDSARSVRWPDFSALPDRWSNPGAIELVYTDNADGSGSNLITDTDDVLFYFTGLTSVADLGTNTYRPGAVADHLTSFGGRLTSNGGQMSAVRWLEGGVTASYGTVVEPCNYQQKFPRVSVLLEHYFHGATVVEAYWKSVNWPGEGVFVGAPLARPWGGARLDFESGTLTIETTAFAAGKTYELSAADSLDGPFETVQQGLSADTPQTVSIVQDGAARPVYRLSEAQ